MFPFTRASHYFGYLFVDPHPHLRGEAIDLGGREGGEGQPGGCLQQARGAGKVAGGKGRDVIRSPFGGFGLGN